MRGRRAAAPVDVAKKLPALVPAAFVAIEDKRFYEHNGYDLAGMARVVLTDVTSSRATRPRGIDHHPARLARNLFGFSERSLERKGLELIYAVELEQACSKQQILGLYLGQGLPPRRLRPTASRRRRELPLRRLGPNTTDHPRGGDAGGADGGRRRTTIRLEPRPSAERTALVPGRSDGRPGAITAAEQQAKALASSAEGLQERLPDGPRSTSSTGSNATFKTMGPPKIDLIVETTLDARDEAAAGRHRGQGDHRTRFAKANVEEQAALVALDGQGRVRAMVGGADYAKSSYNRAVSRSSARAGSSWKPFVYLTALEAGRTPDTPVVDEPVTIDGWSPSNFEPEYLGPITLRGGAG